MMRGTFWTMNLIIPGFLYLSLVIPGGGGGTAEGRAIDPMVGKSCPKCPLRGEVNHISGVRTVPILGHRPVVLGGLYDAVEDDFLPGFNLWDLADVEKNKIVVPHPKQRVQWTTGLEDDDKYDFLSIDKDDKQSVKVDLKL